VKNGRVHFSCHSCGKGSEHYVEKPLCVALKGWLTVSCWKGLGSVAHCNFCSFSCLKSWADAQVPKVPKVFLESFKEEEN